MQFAILEFGSDTPFAVFRNISRLILCQGTKNCEKQLTRGIQGVNILFLKNNTDAEILKLSRIHKAVLRISCKSADGLCNNKVNLTCFAIGYHLLELLTLLCIGS